MHREAAGVVVEGSRAGLDGHNGRPHGESLLTPHPLGGHLHIIIGHYVRQGNLSLGLGLMDLNKDVLGTIKLFNGDYERKVSLLYDSSSVIYCITIQQSLRQIIQKIN